MANFDQNITIDIDVDTGALQSQLAAASAEVKSFKESIDGADTDLSNVSKSIDDAADSQREMGISTEDLTRKIRNEVRSLGGVSDASKTATRALRQMRNATDRSTSSMRAAAEVGDLFEDGLGSLSINIGAFTVALRNMLVQVPLLLTGLGALGAAALGAASAFTALAGAMTGLIGAGLLAQAEEMKNQFSEIDSIAQGLEVVMRNVADIFFQAIEPLTNLSNSVNIFEQSVSFLADGINILAKAIAQLTAGPATEFREFAQEAGQDLVTFQEAVDSFNGESWRNVVGALMKSWALLGDEVTTVLPKINNAIADAIVRSSQLLSKVTNLQDATSQFSDTLSELAELGFSIGGGLLPVFESFSSIVESIASRINEMDDAIVEGLISLTLFFVAFSKISGAIGSIVAVMPSFIGTLATVSTEATGASRSLRGVGSAMTGLLRKFGGFAESIGAFGGITTLANSIRGLGDAQRAIAFDTAAANARFAELALNSNFTADELKDLAIQGKLTTESIDALEDETNELTDSMQNAMLNMNLTEEQMKSLGRSSNTTARGINRIDPGNLTEMDGMTFGGIKELNDVGFDFDGNITKSQKIFNNLDGSIAMVAQTTKNAAVPTSLYAAATQALNASAIKAAFAQNGLAAAIKLAGTQLATATIQALSYIAAQLKLIPSTLSTAGATVVLNAAITSLTGGLSKIIPAIIALTVIIGALAVGAARNADNIKGSFQSMLGGIMSVVGVLVDVLMTVFIATWEAIKMTIQPIVNLFQDIAGVLSLLGSSGKESSSSMSILSDSFDILLGVISGVIRAVGLLGKIVSTVLVRGLGFILTNVLLGLVVVLNTLNDIFGFLVTGLLRVFGVFGEGKGEIKGVMDVISSLISVSLKGLKAFGQGAEDAVNGIIAAINKALQVFNKIPGFDFQRVDKVDLTREELGDGGEADPDAPKANEIEINTDNSTNIDQTVNADPEDQAQLSRVVTDAIEEANSFERRRQGGQ